MSNDCSQIPNFIAGHVIEEIEGGFCQDGARFIFAPSGLSIHLRVKPTNDEAASALEAALQSHDEVVIAAYHCRGAEGCVRYDCYAVWPADQFAAKASNF